MKKIKEIQLKIKELYEHGLTEKQRALALVAVLFVVLVIAIWIYNLAFGPQNDDSGTSIKNSEISQNKTSDTPDGSSIAGSVNDNQTNPAFVFPKTETNKNVNPVTQLPPIPDTDYQAQQAQLPGPMDSTFAKIKEEHKDDPKIVLINGFLFYYKQVADGKRAWNSIYHDRAIEYLGENKARELENEIKRISGDKDSAIRKRNFQSFDELTNAIKKDTDPYIEKVAINQYLEHVQDIAADRYPMDDGSISLGEMNLEKAWIDQIYAKIRIIKDKKAQAFRAHTYKTIEELVGAIKNDTKKFKEIVARDAYLDYVLTLAKNKALTEAVVSSGGYLLENYHLEALSKFVNK